MSDKGKHNGGHRDTGAALESRMQAYLDGELGAADKAAFEAELAASPDLAAELRDYQAICATLQGVGDAYKSACPAADVLGAVMGQLSDRTTVDHDNVVPFLGLDAIDVKIEAELEAIGQAFAENTPAVDLGASILDKVRALEASVQAKRDNIVPLRARPQVPQHAATQKEAGSRNRLMVILALAACLLLVVGVYNRSFLRSQFDTVQQYANQISGGGTVSKSKDATPAPPKNALDVELPKPVLASLPGAPSDSPENMGENIYGSITLDMALDNKRNATLDSEEGIRALARLKSWSTLTPEQARALLEKGDLTPDAILGLAQFLPPDEAAALLEAQARLNPENPFLHFSLASLYAGLGNPSDSLAHLAALEQQDPDNGMSPFMQAAIHREQGNDDMALALLLESALSPAPNAYALEAANYRANALMAQGYDPAVAQYLASLTAGTDEYNRILSTANDFVQYGQAFELAEEYATAMQIYESLNQFGLNVTQNATFSNVQLAGLDTQHAALTAIQGIVNLFQDPVGVQVLVSGLELFNTGLQEINSFFTTFNGVMNEANAVEVASYASDIMRMGDVAFVENLAAEEF